MQRRSFLQLLGGLVSAAFASPLLPPVLPTFHGVPLVVDPVITAHMVMGLAQFDVHHFWLAPTLVDNKGNVVRIEDIDAGFTIAQADNRWRHT